MAEATTVSIEGAFASARAQGRAALMPYLMGGFPDQGTATAVAEAYADAGADLIELGVPFSDPLADGPTIHAADTAALKAGATLESVLETCATVGERLPVALMVYANMILASDPIEFADKAVSAGASGVIVPDLPLEERDPIAGPLGDRGLPLIPLVAPTTPAARQAEISRVAQGFVYAVSVVGTTGERPGEIGEALKAFIGNLQQHASVPVALGFGISTPEQARQFGRVADGVIIGSRLVREVAEARGRDAAVHGVSDFLRATRDALAG